MIEKVFRSSRFIVWVAIIICAVSSLLLYVASVNIIFNTTLDIVGDIPTSADSGKNLAVSLLKLLDLLLIAITFQIMALSLYRLFIRRMSVGEEGFEDSLDINSFHDLKITVSQVAVLILVIRFLEQAVEIGGTIETLYLGVSISIVVLASVFAWKNMKH